MLRKLTLMVCIMAAFAALAGSATAQCGPCDTAPAAIEKIAYPKDRLYMSDAGYYRWQQYQQSRAWMTFKEACEKIATVLANGK